MHNINLDLDKENELVFKVAIEGTRTANIKSRFLVESSEFSLFFPAVSSSGGEISVRVPPLENVISEGSYTSSLEVIIDDKVFTPMSLNTEFKRSVSVVAEVVTRKAKPSTLSVSPVISVNNVKLDLSNKATKPEVRTESISVHEKKEKLSPKRPRSADIQEDTSSKRPARRSGKRPKKNRMSLEANERRILERKIRDLSSKKDANLTDSQVLKLVNFLKNKD